jgi:hypothetical protein
LLSIHKHSLINALAHGSTFAETIPVGQQNNTNLRYYYQLAKAKSFSPKTNRSRRFPFARSPERQASTGQHC